MSRGRKTFSNEFKAKVALEAIKGYKSMCELAREYQVHPNAIGNWKKEAIEGLAEVFNKKRGPKTEANTDLIDQLYRQIGKQQVELDWLKKNLILSLDEKRGLIDSGNNILTISQQCSLIQMHRSSYYLSSAKYNGRRA